MKEIQIKVNKVFKENFGYTPLTERLNDIHNEFLELIRYQDLENLKEEAGDLLSSLLQMCTEQKWDAEELINKTLTKIERRSEQYKSLGRKTKVAILGGAFNPIHLGHIQLAQFVLNSTGLFDEVWLMPANEHMGNKALESADHRLEMCRLAAEKDGRIKIFDYEIKNKLRGETYFLLKRMKEEVDMMDKYQFSFIIGQDNANSFDKWVNHTELERMAQFIVIPRKGVERDYNVNWYLQKPHIFLNIETDIIEVSSTHIRELLHGDIWGARHFLGDKVLNYIIENKLYGMGTEYFFIPE